MTWPNCFLSFIPNDEMKMYEEGGNGLRLGLFVKRAAKEKDRHCAGFL